jgi:structural maintenance of chromosome 3 (chondroitin sulfate proteoglycan 6)
LFQVVVDTVETASRLLEHLNREKSGRVTFMPLDKIRVKRVDYPDTKDAIPVVKRLRYDPILENAFQQAFGKTLICRDLEIAGDFSKSYNLNCVTLTGFFFSFFFNSFACIFVSLSVFEPNLHCFLTFLR